MIPSNREELRLDGPPLVESMLKLNLYVGKNLISDQMYIRKGSSDEEAVRVVGGVIGASIRLFSSCVEVV